MTNKAEVTCVSKSDRYDPHERITHIGGRGSSPWRITQQDAIGKIERREWDFYVSKNGAQARVIVAVSRYGNKYLKTEPDGEQPNNLLSLPECPK